MKIHRTSTFKDPQQDQQWFLTWVAQIEAENNYRYQHIKLDTCLGKTHIWCINPEAKDYPILIIFPGARTSVLFWDLDQNLAVLRASYRIYMVETNGLPNLSEGHTPDIRSKGFGLWGKEIMDLLQIDKAFIAGASFGGLVGMKMSMVIPDRIQALFLLNAGGLSPFSLSIKNLYYNLRPVISPNKGNIRQFLEKAVFHAPQHQLSLRWMELVIDYEHFAITRYHDKSQKPYYLGKEMMEVAADVYILEGTADLLFPYEKSLSNARKYLPALKEVHLFEGVGHGIETHQPAIQKVYEVMEELKGDISTGVS